jgi:hypothetical protein
MDTLQGTGESMCYTPLGSRQSKHVQQSHKLARSRKVSGLSPISPNLAVYCRK